MQRETPHPRLQQDRCLHLTPKEEDDLTPKTKENVSLEELMQTWMAKMHDSCIFISARERDNIDELKTLMYNRVRELHVQKYPYNDFLYQTYEADAE